MLTDKQKETISILKTAYKQINSETNCIGVFLDVNSIISEHQKGKSMIDEISLHNKAIKSSQYATSTLGYFQIESKYLPYERINDKLLQRIHSPIYRISFSSGNNSYGSCKGFEALLNRDEVKEAVLKTYNRDNR